MTVFTWTLPLPPTPPRNLTRDLNFNGAIPGNVYAQPLYIEGGPNGQALVIAVTESNYVCALDPASGNIVWQRQVGASRSPGQTRLRQH